jgi:hypothetical protein
LYSAVHNRTSDTLKLLRPCGHLNTGLTNTNIHANADSYPIVSPDCRRVAHPFGI